MKIILLDKIQKLGEIGDVVEVRSGHARNFLIPKKKAMFASDENLKYVESKKAELAAASADEMAALRAAGPSPSTKTSHDSIAIDAATGKGVMNMTLDVFELILSIT